MVVCTVDESCRPWPVFSQYIDTGTDSGELALNPNGASQDLAVKTVTNVVTGLNAGTYGQVSDASGAWLLGDGSGTTAADSSGQGHYGTLTGTGATWSTDHPAATVSTGSVVLDGVAGAVNGAVHSSTGMTVTVPAVDTLHSFTVSAWVKLASTASAGNQTFVSQDGINVSGFYLQYNKAANSWVFSRPQSDLANPVLDTASGGTVATGTWTHLVGVYNVVTGAMTLYVNAVQAGTSTDLTPFATSGALAIGRGLENGAAADFATGQVSEVKTFQPSPEPGRDHRALQHRRDDHAGRRHYLPHFDFGLHPRLGHLRLDFAPASDLGDRPGRALELTTTSSYTTDGRVITAASPGGNTAGATQDSKNPYTTKTLYYDDISNGDSDCAGHPAWATMICKTEVTGQPGVTGLPGLKTTWTKSYTAFGAASQTVQTVTDAGGTAQTQTTTTTFDPISWRPVRASIVGTAGAAIQDVTTGYDAATGAVGTTSTVDGSNNTTATITNGYDDFGRQTAYTDAAGEKTTTVYDAAGRISTLTDSKGTRTYTYNGGGDQRDLPSTVTDTGLTAGSFTGVYDGNGNLVEQVLPDGLQEVIVADTAGQIVQKAYASTASGTWTLMGALLRGLQRIRPGLRVLGLLRRLLGHHSGVGPNRHLRRRRSFDPGRRHGQLHRRRSAFNRLYHPRLRLRHPGQPAVADHLSGRNRRRLPIAPPAQPP